MVILGGLEHECEYFDLPNITFLLLAAREKTSVRGLGLEQIEGKLDIGAEVRSNCGRMPMSPQ